ncbi:hypothetical protein OCH239_04305 [Roseivivax halodurans JCM 10272]|uniref:Uncharacterized protein n=1 Tax=Roseivivax halodurans JCM 10272 TaxID=1449350 RepID=X7EGS8_9RHOB|nr:hypothetical protein OCH239_04305 [Roseivivax halodurans JCM 10272]
MLTAEICYEAIQASLALKVLFGMALRHTRDDVETFFGASACIGNSLIE